MNKIKTFFKEALKGIVGIIMIVFGSSAVVLIAKLFTKYVTWLWAIL